MRKVKLFFLLTALLAIAQGAWAATKTFTSYSQGNNTQSPVTVNCAELQSSSWIRLRYGGSNIQISVSAGYTITEVKFSASIVETYGGKPRPITATNGTLSNNTPGGLLGNFATATVSNVNNTQTVLQTEGYYLVSQIQVTYTTTYTVNYNGNGSTSGSTASQTKTLGVTLQLRNNGYSRTGYTFSRWNTQANGQGTNYNAGANYTANAAATMYAQWTANTYTVTFDKQSGSGGSNSVTATYGSAMPSITKPTRTGYTFGGYFTGTGGSGTQYYNANGGSVRSWDKTSNTTLYAKWTANTYTVSFDKQSGTGGSNSVTATYGSAMPSMTRPTRTGYTFGGYYDQKDGAGTQYYYASGGSVRSWNKTSNTTLYAKWTVNQYTIKFNNYDGTQLQSSQVNYGATPAYTGATPTKPSTAAYAYTFNGWSPAIATVTGNATYTAQFTEQINQATVDAAIALINAIDNPVVYTTACHDEITDARTAYEALTAEQKALVDATTLQVLTDAEAAYAALEADHNAANAVIDLINAIDDPVVYTDACHQEILDAREAYDNLTGDQQALVGNYATLTDAEDAYASLNVDITAKLDPEHPRVYYSTFYDGSRQLQLPADVKAYVATISGTDLLLTKIAQSGQVIPADNAVILKSNVQNYTLTPSDETPVSFSVVNSLQGTDVAVAVPDNCYVFSGHSSDNSVTGVGFYRYTGANLNPHKAYVLSGGSSAPRRMRFIFAEEQTATGVENAGTDMQNSKVLENGVFYIIRDGVRYNAQGQIVK